MITQTRPIRQPKSLQEQQSDRKRRAEEQRSNYRLSWHPCKVTLRDGSTRIETVTGVVKLDGTGSYYVTSYGCSCPDACRARAAGIKRTCKHERLCEMALAEMTFPEDPEPYCTDEERAEETLRTLETARREAFRARMNEDFPEF